MPYWDSCATLAALIPFSVVLLRTFDAMQFKLKASLISAAIVASIVAIFCRDIVWLLAAVAVLFSLLVFGEDIWNISGKLSSALSVLN